jgi:hypothetical protein
MEVSDQLANLGAMIAGGIEKNVQQTQFNNALPGIQQAFQSAMTDFDAGRSGAGFSKIMAVAMENPNNPMIQNISQMAFKAGKEASDSYSYRLKGQQQPSIADAYLAKQLGLTPAAVENEEEDSNIIDQLDKPLPLTEYEVNSDNSFADTRTKVTEGGIQAGLASQNFVTDFDAADFNKEKLPAGATKYIGAGVDTILVPKDLTKLKKSGATLKGSIGNITFDAVDNDPTKIGEQRLNYRQELSRAIKFLDKNQQVQDLIKFYGGFDKIPPSKEGTKGELVWNITDENGKLKTIKLGKGTEGNPQIGNYFVDITDAANQANLIGTPLFMSGEAEVPAFALDRKAQAAKFLSQEK